MQFMIDALKLIIQLFYSTVTKKYNPEKAGEEHEATVNSA